LEREECATRFLAGPIKTGQPSFQSREATMKIVIACLMLSLAAAACSPSDGDVTGATGSCAAKLYRPYNPRDVKQCVDVCIRCDRGVMATCSTSCFLKGAQ
jgi:hypothetical protein